MQELDSIPDVVQNAADAVLTTVLICANGGRVAGDCRSQRQQRKGGVVNTRGSNRVIFYGNFLLPRHMRAKIAPLAAVIPAVRRACG